MHTDHTVQLVGKTLVTTIFEAYQRASIVEAQQSRVGLRTSRIGTGANYSKPRRQGAQPEARRETGPASAESGVGKAESINKTGVRCFQGGELGYLAETVKRIIADTESNSTSN